MVRQVLIWPLVTHANTQHQQGSLFGIQDEQLSLDWLAGMSGLEDTNKCTPDGYWEGLRTAYHVYVNACIHSHINPHKGVLHKLVYAWNSIWISACMFVGCVHSCMNAHMCMQKVARCWRTTHCSPRTSFRLCRQPCLAASTILRTQPAICSLNPLWPHLDNIFN